MTLKSSLRGSEGLRLKPYLDTAEPPVVTIGYGCNLESNTQYLPADLAALVRRGQTGGQVLLDQLNDRGFAWTEDQAEQALEEEVRSVVDEVLTRWPWVGLINNEARRNVVFEMAYNMGIGRLSGFKRFLAAVRAGQWGLAANEMMDSRWARQLGDGWGKRLDRVERLAIQMRDGKEVVS